MTKVLCRMLLLMAILCLSGGLAAGETVFWINPDGGRYYHLDPNCPSVNPRYCPLQVSLAEGERPYLPCPVCVDDNLSGDPEEAAQTGTSTEDAEWEMILDPQYADYALTDYYIDEPPVFLREHDMLARARPDPHGYSGVPGVLLWYRDGELYREATWTYGDSSRLFYEGIFLALPDGSSGAAVIAPEGLSFFRWEESGMVLQKRIPGNWRNLYGIPEGLCAMLEEDQHASAHLFDPEGNELWSFDYGDTDFAWLAEPVATDGAGTYLVNVIVDSDLYTIICVRDGQTAWKQNLLYSGSAFYAGNQSFILTETTSGKDPYADLILDHRDANGKSMGTKKLSGDRVVKSVHAIQYHPETGGYTLYGQAVANSRNVYTVFRMELDERMNQLDISVRDFSFHNEYSFSVLAAERGEAYVYCNVYDDSWVQPVLVPFSVLDETDPHGLKLH